MTNTEFIVKTKKDLKMVKQLAEKVGLVYYDEQDEPSYAKLILYKKLKDGPEWVADRCLIIKKGSTVIFKDNKLYVKDGSRIETIKENGRLEIIRE